MSLSEKSQKIFDLIKELTVVELNDLVKSLEEEFGVSAAPMMIGGGAPVAEEAAEKDTVNVELTEIGQQKIAVIKVVKESLNLWLKEAKDLVEKAPTVVKENVKLEEADILKAKLEEAGAKVTLK